MPFKSLNVLFSVLVLLIGVSSMAKAEDAGEMKPDFEHFYDDITMDKISKLYWKLGKMDINNNDHVDNFLFINECDIHKDYFFNEFEWVTVRKKAKAFLLENMETFPVRFKYVQPLRLTEYDEASGQFNIHDKFQIKGYRKFEVLSKDFSEKICTKQGQENITDYPRILMVELTQPLTLKSIPMTSKMAKEYVEEKMQRFDLLGEGQKTKENLYKYRDAYIVMKLKMFSYKGMQKILNGWERASIYGMLEGYEIYADKDHTKLLYFENFIRDRDSAKPVNVRLREQYEAMRRKRGENIEIKGNESKDEPVNDLMNLKKDTQ